MIIKEIIWFESVVEKLQSKHSVSQNEVREVFENNPRFFFAEEGNFQGEDVYTAMGRTDAGRYLIIFFIIFLIPHPLAVGFPLVPSPWGEG